MPWSALPEHLNTPEKWHGTDWDTWYQRWMLKFKGFFAFGPRAAESWARWRETPKLLFAIGGRGPWRIEGGSIDMASTHVTGGSWASRSYLSRIQYWKRWHFQIQWPLMIAFHWYWRAADVPKPGERPTDLGIKKMVYAYGPTHFDNDGVYWLLSFYLGGVWK